jgi:hypothetical protein
MWSYGGGSGHDDAERDAECISGALQSCDAEIEPEGRRWSVHLSLSVQLSGSEGDAALPELLTALKQCLDENEIAAVKVELDGQAYAMEGLSQDVA